MRRDLDASARGQALHTESVSPQPAAAHQSTYLAKCPNSRPKQQLAQNTQVSYQGQLATRGLLEPPACPETQFFLQNVKTARSHHPVTDVPFSGVLLQLLRALSAHRVWEHQLQDWSSRSSLRNELLGHECSASSCVAIHHAPVQSMSEIRAVRWVSKSHKERLRQRLRR